MTFPRLSDGASARPARTLRFARPAQVGVVALVAAAVALTPASGAVAAGSDHKPQASTAVAKPNGKAEAKPGSAGVGGRERWWGFGKALHGEQFVERADGTVADVVFQYGTITAITDTSVTLASKDGFTVSWALTPATKIWVRGHHKGQTQVPVVGDRAGLWGTGPAATPTALQFVVSTERRKTPPAQPTTPAQPTDPAQPTTPAQPTDPAGTSSSTAPADPGANAGTSTSTSTSTSTAAPAA